MKTPNPNDERIVDSKSDMDQVPVPLKSPQQNVDPIPVVVTYYTVEQFHKTFDHCVYPMVIKGPHGAFLLRCLDPKGIENYICVPISWMFGMVPTNQFQTHVVLPCHRTDNPETCYAIERGTREKDNVLDFITFMSSGRELVVEH